MTNDEVSSSGKRSGFCHSSAFTLIELLVVISILGILAALSVPAFKTLGKANGGIAASRQLLDDVARARQLAMNQRSTVYMVFVPTNFWDITPGSFNSSWWGSLNDVEKNAATNICGLQLTGYTFISLRSVGDQPGQNNPRYLGRWQSLPENTFIAQEKFIATNTIYDPISGNNFPIARFDYTNFFPFPTADTVTPIAARPYLPYIAFNYLGQLTDDGQNLADFDAYIPLARGSVIPQVVPNTKAYVLDTSGDGSPSVQESPSGNSTNTYNIVHIDRLTGRAVLEYQKVK